MFRYFMNRKTAITLFLGLMGFIIIEPIFSQQPKSDRILSAWDKSRPAEELTIEYPMPGALFPPEIIAPTFLWKDKTDKTDAWLVVGEVENTVKIVSPVVTQQEWRPSQEQWTTMKTSSLEKDMRITVLGIRGNDPDNVVSSGQTTIGTSRDEVGASIFYRDVPLPFEFAYQNLDTIRWRLGDVASDGPTTVILKDLPLCGNCHSFTPDGKTLAMDVDYANDKGSYVITSLEKDTILTPEKIISWSDYRREDGEMTFGLLSQISPDGRYALSTVKDRSIFVPIDNLTISQLFFPLKGIIAVYDRDQEKFWSLPGADNPEYCQSNPNWSPDGEYIIFAKAPVYHSKIAESFKQAVLPTSVAAEFIEGRQGYKYDLYRIPFNNGEGGKAEPIPGAFNNGKSNYFPRISPDGRWIVFCQAKNFMLLQPDSTLYIMPAEGGTPRQMNCNLSLMNSWHSWSPNGRWLIFASKHRGPYTQLYMTHIDENGNDTPAVLLENFVLPERAVNIPEFINTPKTQWASLVDSFTQAGNYYLRIGEDKFFMQDYEGAIFAYNIALEQNQNDPDILIKRGEAKSQLKNYQGALEDIGKALNINSRQPVAYKKRGDVKFDMGNLKDALADYDEAIRLNAQYWEAYDRRGNTKLQSGDASGALKDINRAIELKSNDSTLFRNRALVKSALKDYRGALEDCETAIDLDPEYGQNYKTRGDFKLALQDPKGAIADYTKAIELLPDFVQAFEGRGGVYYATRNFREALKDMDQAIKLMPDNFELYSKRGDIKYESKDIRGAIGDYDTSIRLNPNFALNYFKRGMIKIITGNSEEGCEDLKKADQLGFKGALEQIKKYCTR
ncbi:MAG TPA: tetratricopeptide repeat protein [Candidatus Heimdallarchaeota archaeon]|nr:tetratricopeptide repeat protein [Candidatus Heimdallarchaeota archaeon]